MTAASSDAGEPGPEQLESSRLIVVVRVREQFLEDILAAAAAIHLVVGDGTPPLPALEPVG